MLNWLRNLLRTLFGGSDKPAPPAPVPAPPPAPVPAEESAPLTIKLERYSPGHADTLGKLWIGSEQVCLTLEEAPGKSLPAGTYRLALRTTGGKHTAYAYRFGDWHRGMIQILSPQSSEPRYIHIGNDAKYAYGSVLVGKEAPQADQTQTPREIWYSEEAYKALYPRIADVLAAGKPVQLTIV